MDYERLLFELEQKLREDPQNTALMSNTAIAYIENNRYDKAIELLEKAAMLKPSVETLTNLSWYYLHEGKLTEEGYYKNADEEAVELLERAVQCKPKSYLTYAALGEAYLRTDRYHEAETVLRRSIEIKAVGFSQNNLGIALYKQNRIQEALPWFENAFLTMKEQDNNFQVARNYGGTLAVLGQRAEAEEIARFLLNNKENNELYYDALDIAELFYITENYMEAAKLYNSYEYNLGAGLLEFYAYALIMCGEKQKALNLMQRAIDANNDQILENQKDDELSDTEVKELAQLLLTENIKLKELMESLKQGIKPILEFEPYLAAECYLYGCHMHNNPEADSMLI